MKVKIVSDGDVEGTRLFDEKGNDITAMVTGIRWAHDARGIPHAEVSLGFVAFEGTVIAGMMGPNGKDVRRIEYADGSFDEFPE